MNRFADDGSTAAAAGHQGNVPDGAAVHLARGGAVVLFDGVCNLCNASVLFVIDRDPGERFAFAPLQSAEAARLLVERGYAGAELSSVLLVEGERVHARSTAALRIARHLSGGWPLLSAFIVVPRFIRDAVYDWIGRNRYRWFGRQEACRIPTPELRSRFVGAASDCR
ncbi:MAG: thiol-disulfide oxidoreductase DCC family protein [Gemmatimonadaceae bacterium]